MIKYEDFTKLDLRIGEVVSTKNDSIEIDCGGKILKTKISLNTKKGDKIVVGIIENELIIPLSKENNPLTPDQDIEAGSIVG